VGTAVAEAFGITAIRDEYQAARVTTLRLPAPYKLARGRRNPVAEWLDGLGLFGARAQDKHIPDPVFSFPKAQVALFLRHLWATAGSVTVNKTSRRGRIHFSSPSRRMADGVAMLLLRFGIVGRVTRTCPGRHRDQYSVDIAGGDDQRRFLQEIGVHGPRGLACETLRATIADAKPRTTIDTIPAEIWTRVREILGERTKASRPVAAAAGRADGGGQLWGTRPSRSQLARVAAILEDAELDLHSVNDVLWDEILTIESIGEHEVFDATVPGLHNFVANGVVAHNSIEQDADVVILLHRDDYYDRESPRAGEADFIVAKHRNGPTDTVTVAAQLHFSRFVDMAV
jgi:replicative DNA helicase